MSVTSQSFSEEHNDFGKRLPWSIPQIGEMAIENHEILNSSTLI